MLETVQRIYTPMELIYMPVPQIGIRGSLGETWGRGGGQVSVSNDSSPVSHQIKVENVSHLPGGSPVSISSQ